MCRGGGGVRHLQPAAAPAIARLLGHQVLSPGWPDLALVPRPRAHSPQGLSGLQVTFLSFLSGTQPDTSHPHSHLPRASSPQAPFPGSAH